MKRLRLPLTLSLGIHAALAALLFWGAFSIYESERGGAGSGGVVSVWVAGPDGESAGDGRVSPARSVRPPSGAMQSSEPASRQIQGAAGGGSQATGEGSGEGVGSGQGAGMGSGSGGNPVLARIWKKINRSKYYPEGAKSRGLEGSPRVTFTISEDGSVESVALASSCGEALLDDAARETIRRAAPLPFYPGPITLTVKYSLAD